MQNWQEQRNYRKHKNADGSFTYIVTVDGTDVEVSAEVYAAYSQEDRRERYSAERDAGRLLSFDGMNEDDGLLAYLMDRCTESAEDTLFNAEKKAERNRQTEKAAAAFLALEPDERNLIQALVLDGVTECDYAALVGLTQQGVNKRKKKILEKLKKSVVKP